MPETFNFHVLQNILASIHSSKANYCMVGMFGRVNAWQIAELKVVGKKSLANGWILAIRIPFIS